MQQIIPRSVAFLFFVWIAFAEALTNFDDWAHQRIALENVSIHLRYAGKGPPVLLIHGSPQFSLTWHTVGPILAEKYTVIAVDNPGSGDSSVPSDGDYTFMASADTMKSVLDFFNITSTYVIAHDVGCGIAAALATKYRSLVKRLVVAEFALPGFGYETSAAPAPYWDLYANWQLAFFSVTDAAEFFISGKEKQLIEWYIYHGSYSGSSSFSEDMINRYSNSISKPGFLRAMLGPFDNRAVTAAATFFTATLGKTPLQIPTLAIGGEASLGPASKAIWGNVSSHLQTDIVSKAGHWIADENPIWVANRVLRFLEQDKPAPSPIDLSYLANKVTLDVGYFGTLENAQSASDV
ncbi:Alpha/Beta hydrolase protein [Xylogone sp. PMI_703]|nr:Alpha/Beta hydrolase protein [Xylogone sp. PMI_703]